MLEEHQLRHACEAAPLPGMHTSNRGNGIASLVVGGEVNLNPVEMLSCPDNTAPPVAGVVGERVHTAVLV
jgi:hypothetical protein